MAGDVIGCCIDLDDGTISYSRSASAICIQISYYSRRDDLKS